MAESLWTSTLAEFRDQLASKDPVPAGVSLAAVSASLGLSLLTKVLDITGNRRDFKGDPAKIDEWVAAARTASCTLQRCADEDVVAFASYMASRRTPNEAAALRKAIETPLAAARAAALGLKLGAEAAVVTPASIAPDLRTVTLLLAAAVHAILLSVESNALYLTDPELRDEIAREVEILQLLAKKHQQW